MNVADLFSSLYVFMLKKTLNCNRVVDFVLYGPGRNVCSPQTVSCPLQAKSSASYYCLEILAYVEVCGSVCPVSEI